MNQNLRRYYDTKDRFPHLANAFKYAFAMTVGLFGVFHPNYKNTNAGVTAYQVHLCSVAHCVFVALQPAFLAAY